MSVTNPLGNVPYFAVAGDWHGNTRFATKALSYARRNGANVVLHLGDFGAWPDGATTDNDPRLQCHYINTLEQHCAQEDILLLFIDGNHENHPWLNSLPVDEDGVRRITEHVWHLPRGFTWEWGGTRFMALGGAYSVDRWHRTLGVSYFEEETISLADANRAVEAGEVDVMFTHDCPDQVEIPLKGDFDFPHDALIAAEAHRALLGMVVDEVKPKHLYHGHFHVRYDGVRDSLSLTGVRTEIHGLHCDHGSPTLAHNVVFLESSGLSHTA